MESRPESSDVAEFAAGVRAASLAQLGDAEFRAVSHEWMVASARRRYSYNFSWLGLPIIQYPQDIVAIQELVWQVRPTLVIETGVARGGSMALLASLMALLDAADRNPVEASRRRVIGVDIDVRPWNREAIESHPLSHYIQLIEGSSVDDRVVDAVTRAAEGHERVMVLLDSNHRHAHVLAELRSYAPLVSAGSYCVVFDTGVEQMPPDALHGRPWGPGDSPGSAVATFLAEDDRFAVDEVIDGRLMLSVAPGGFLKRVR